MIYQRWDLEDILFPDQLSLKKKASVLCWSVLIRFLIFLFINLLHESLSTSLMMSSSLLSLLFWYLSPFIPLSFISSGISLLKEFTRLLLPFISSSFPSLSFPFICSIFSISSGYLFCTQHMKWRR